MALSACRCRFQRYENSRPEHGIAVTRFFGEASIICIIPDDAASPLDVVDDVWNYSLDWMHSIDADRM